MILVKGDVILVYVLQGANCKKLRKQKQYEPSFKCPRMIKKIIWLEEVWNWKLGQSFTVYMSPKKITTGISASISFKL